MSTAPVLPETAAVYWRPRLDAARLRRRELGWTLSTFAHTIPFLAVAALMLYLEPLSFPVAAIAIVHAWGIPALYANRGACVVRPRPRADDGSERTALGLLGDLLGHEARELHARTGLVQAKPMTSGARPMDADLPSADRTAHLLLALREDEAGFATVANLAFSGGTWRLRHRLPKPMRPALAAARAIS